MGRQGTCPCRHPLSKTIHEPKRAQAGPGRGHGPQSGMGKNGRQWIVCNATKGHGGHDGGTPCHGGTDHGGGQDTRPAPHMLANSVKPCNRGKHRNPSGR